MNIILADRETNRYLGEVDKELLEQEGRGSDLQLPAWRVVVATIGLCLSSFILVIFFA